jgi:predicted nucleic acid-binding protein
MQPIARDVYLDTSLIAAAIIAGSTHHDAARDYCQQLAEQECNVYFSQFLRVELLQAFRVIGTDPTGLPEVTRRRHRLGRWGSMFECVTTGSCSAAADLTCC